MVLHSITSVGPDNETAPHSYLAFDLQRSSKALGWKCFIEAAHAGKIAIFDLLIWENVHIQFMNQGIMFST